MPGFLYFVPVTSKEIAREVLEKLAPHALERAGGSGPMFNQVSIPEAEAAGGPEGPGYVVGREGFYTYDADSQEWRKAPGERLPRRHGDTETHGDDKTPSTRPSEKVPAVLRRPPCLRASSEAGGSPSPAYWLGYDRAHPPGPDDLARDRQLAGHPVELGDGKDWLVPAARRFDPDSTDAEPYLTLPATLRRGADGHWEAAEVLPEYRAFWRVAQAVSARYARLLKGEPDAFAGWTWDDQAAFIVQALAVNYRLGEPEMDCLGLLTTGTLIPVFRAVMDAPTLVEILKKKGRASGGDSTSPGGGD